MDQVERDPAGRDAGERLLELVAALHAELRPGQVRPVRLDSQLERELGFDSLARAELLLRIERGFGIGLPQRLLSEAETPSDFLDELNAAAGRATVPAAVPTATGAATAPSDDGAPAPDSLATLVDVLAWHARHQPERTHIVYIAEDGAETTVSYGSLAREARTAAAALQGHGIVPGDSVALMLPTCAEFFGCFFGILLAGGVPVPIYPPARPSQLEDHLRRHAAILDNAQARLLIASGEVALPAELLHGQVASLRGVVLARELLAADEPAEPIAVPWRPDDLALLQYTSGSTGTPKGVMLTHAQLLANIRAMGTAAHVGRSDVFVSWLPLYHDMGLISAWLSSMAYAIPFVVMSPLTFLARPERWLQAISRHRGTLSGAPNFAYELCVKRIDDAALAGLDLSSWRLAFNGAEPVGPDTMERFAARFAGCGLRRTALAPVYGLAECAVGLALTPERGPLIDRIVRAPFVAGGEALPAAADDADAMRFAVCGRPLPGYELRVVDAAGAELPERREGRLQFRGPSATDGYLRNPAATAQLIRDGWHDTGDYAYLAEGEVVPTGRAKDIIIKGGRNIYPQEVEEAVGSLAGIRKGCVAVFGSPDPASGTERLVVVAETREADAAALEALRGRVQDAVVGLLGEPADDVVLSAGRVVLKTSSGKVRRAASRELYETGATAQTAPRAVWLQVARLVLAGLLPQARRGLRAAVDRLLGICAAGSFLPFAVLAWLLVAVSPSSASSWRACGVIARLWLRLAGIRLEVAGLEHLPAPGRQVVVINHASYLDGIALVAALPSRGWRFVAKRELEDDLVPRVFLRRLGSVFVERFDFRQGVADAARLTDEVAAGHALAFFPEGTFTRIPGLRPFRMGAFLVAAQNGATVLPVALAGTRDVLRADTWLPRRGRVGVTVMPALVPDGNDWVAAVRLRDAARAEILKACGEGDLSA
jgi:1-acyl-sn-glycerol-3-phosphate acyltransferase